MLAKKHRNTTMGIKFDIHETSIFAKNDQSTTFFLTRQHPNTNNALYRILS